MAWIMKYKPMQCAYVDKNRHPRLITCKSSGVTWEKFVSFAGEKETKMKDIKLEESKIKINEKWFSAEEIAEEIQKKIQAGDMKIAAYATALEKLTIAIENSHVIDVRLALTKDEYNMLKKIGDGDDVTCVRKAIQQFIYKKKRPEKGSLEKKYSATMNASPSHNEPDKIIGKCIKCKSSIEIPLGTNPENILCSACMDSDKDELSDSQVKFTDHFLG